MWPFNRSKRQDVAPVPAPALDGFFSTQTDGSMSKASLTSRVSLALKRSIQRELTLDHPVDEKGNAVAMDGSIQQAKMLASSNGFLPIQQIEYYAAQGFIGWQMCAILAQNWLIQKACGMPGQDAVRHGWEHTVNDGTKLDEKVLPKLRYYDDLFKIKKNCEEHMYFARVFGIRHTLFLVDHPEGDAYYERPFNPDSVTAGKYTGMTQIDPYWLAPVLDGEAAADPKSKHFYEPTWWIVNGKRIHRTHFVISRNLSDVADILKPSYFYGGIPTTQKIYERVYASERTANEAPLLMMSKRLITLTMDITQAMANWELFTEKMGQWSQLMNNFGVKVLGENETAELQDTALDGTDETIMTQYQLVAATAQVPVTKLLGTTPKGFNATGEYDAKSYHEFLETIQKNELTPLVNRHNLLVMRSFICPEFGVSKEVTIETQWAPTDSPTAKEQAEINKTKADTDKTLSDAGALDGLAIQQRLINDPDSGYNGMELALPEEPDDGGQEPDEGDVGT